MVRAIVGANWGDEGKGKITDMLGEKSDIIVRFQGGSNAGHTIINEYGKFALHLLPSGVFYQHTTCIIGNGVALNIPYLQKEIDSIVSQGVPKPNILVSDRAQILMPYHIDFDAYEEERLGKKSFGSTKSGSSTDSIICPSVPSPIIIVTILYFSASSYAGSIKSTNS